MFTVDNDCHDKGGMKFMGEHPRKRPNSLDTVTDTIANTVLCGAHAAKINIVTWCGDDMVSDQGAYISSSYSVIVPCNAISSVHMYHQMMLCLKWIRILL